MSEETESRLTPGLGFHLGENGQWVVEEIPEDVLATARFSGFLTIHGYKCTVFETPSLDQWAQKSVGTVASIHNIAVRMAAEESNNWIYHLTYYNNLPSIESMGLVPTAGGALGRGGYAGHSTGRLFMTEEGGIPYWYDRLEQHAHDLSDNIYESEHIPVVMRLVEPQGLVQDELGVRDSRNGSFYVAQEIPPDGIEIWNGKEWTPIYNWETIDPLTALNVDHYEEDGEEIESYDFKPHPKNPLIP